jgi:DNA-binding MarR family transcriptional regulator
VLHRKRESDNLHKGVNLMATSERSKSASKSRRRARTIYLLNQAHFAMRMQVDEALKPFEVSGLQYTMLSLIGLHPGSSSAELSRRFFRTQQAMGQLLTGLEARGWLVREEDPSNRRMLRVTLTDTGQSVVTLGGKAIDSLEQAAFSQFDDEEIAMFRSVLEALGRHAPVEEEY